ncbi:MAG: hypothetical protein ACE5EB_03945 [Thermodesulfobacteriota bacterium]
MTFFRSYRFFLPFLLVLALEIFFRLGLYEPFVKRQSHAGRSIQLKKAVNEHGKRRIHFVTLGDSRVDHGLDHKYLLRTSKKYNADHVSFAMPGTHLMTLEVLWGWLGKDFPDFKGVLLGLSSSSMLKVGNGAYELGMVQPFRSMGDFAGVLPHVPFNPGRLETYGGVSALFQYRLDFKDLIFHPLRRLGYAVFGRPSHWKDILAHGPINNFNICSIDFKSPKSCLQSLRQIESGSITRKAEEDLGRNHTVCTKYSNKRPIESILSGQGKKIKESWRSLIESIASKKKLIVVLMPEHSFIRRYYTPDGSHQWALSILAPLEEEGKLVLIDLRRRFSNEEECRFFIDPLHLNTTGMKTITREIIPLLKTNFYQTHN